MGDQSKDRLFEFRAILQKLHEIRRKTNLMGGFKSDNGHVQIRLQKNVEAFRITVYVVFSILSDISFGKTASHDQHSFDVLLHFWEHSQH